MAGWIQGFILYHKVQPFFKIMIPQAADNIDRHGHETLNVIAQADKFNEWMYETVRPFISGTVLEIGSGIGNMSEFLIRSAEKLYVSDFNETYISVLQKKFLGHEKLGDVFSIDLNDPDFDKKFASLFNSFNSISRTMILP
jgi:16S rRNA A1518/A1519 N6-dimethyltransferase RsmA/KsgA/DIM1 with predicted DNA glycosylase/AP lyase activity